MAGVRTTACAATPPCECRHGDASSRARPLYPARRPLAAVAALCTLIFMATGSLFSMDVLDQLWWALASFVLLRLLRRQALYLWSIVGAILEPSALEMWGRAPSPLALTGVDMGTFRIGPDKMSWPGRRASTRDATTPVRCTVCLPLSAPGPSPAEQWRGNRVEVLSRGTKLPGNPSALRSKRDSGIGST
jgi:hypothetical protein